jgi:hypothetical protein
MEGTSLLSDNYHRRLVQLSKDRHLTLHTHIRPVPKTDYEYHLPSFRIDGVEPKQEVG